MPAVTDLRRLRRQYAASMTPTTVVLLQELERFNYLIVKMLQTLTNLGKVRRDDRSSDPAALLDSQIIMNVCECMG